MAHHGGWQLTSTHVVCQLVLFFLPLIIHHHDISLADYASAGGDRDFWSSWWTAPYGIWVLQGFWVLCMAIQYSALVRTLAAKFQFQTPAVCCAPQCWRVWVVPCAALAHLSCACRCVVCQEQGVAHSKRKWIRFFAPLGCFVWVVRHRAPACTPPAASSRMCFVGGRCAPSQLSHVFQGRVWRLYKCVVQPPVAGVHQGLWRRARVLTVSLLGCRLQVTAGCSHSLLQAHAQGVLPVPEPWPDHRLLCVVWLASGGRRRDQQGVRVDHRRRTVSTPCVAGIYRGGGELEGVFRTRCCRGVVKLLVPDGDSCSDPA